MIDYDYVIAADPGANGALAVLDYNGGFKTWLFATERKKLISDLPKYLTSAYIVLEEVHALYGSSADRTFGFGRNLGHLEGIIEALGGEVDLRVEPELWQRVVTFPPIKIPSKELPEDERDRAKKDHKEALKLESIRAAEAAYPGSTRWHDGIADAINIARYGLIMLRGRL